MNNNQHKNRHKNNEQNSHMNWTLIQKFLRNKQIFIKNPLSNVKIKNNDYRL